MNRAITAIVCCLSFFLFSPEYTLAEGDNGSWTRVHALEANDILPESPAMIDISDSEVMLVGIGTDAYFYNTVTDTWRKQTRFPTYVDYVNPSIVKLHDGRVLVTGMMGYTGDRSVPAQIYNPATKIWVDTAQLEAPFRLNHTTTLLRDGSVLLAGGFGGSQAQSKYHLGESNIYDPKSNRWNTTTSLHQPRSLHAATQLTDGSVLVAGGHGNTFIGDILDYTRAYSIKSVEKYLPASGEWEIMSDMQRPRSAHTATLLPDGKVLVVGGLLLDTPEIEKRIIATTSAELYDPSTDTWAYTGEMHEERAYHTATLLPDGKVLVTGGMNGEPSSSSRVQSLSSAEVYDPVSETWSAAPDFQDARGKHAAGVLPDGNVFIAGGINNSTDDPYVYSGVNSAEIFHREGVLYTQDGIRPFLRLPFDYAKNGKRFEQVAYNPSAWFDHVYPLQNIACCTQKVTKYNYNGSDAYDYYRSHSGYDYALMNGVKLGTPVLAAAAGKAAFVPAAKSGGGGNVIKIDHGNGYQTWYEHLDAAGLVVSQEGEQVSVSSGQQIGKVGMTGNTTGPHLHFSVFTDENNNNSFVDDYPFGLVDALGWEGKNRNGVSIDDPWTLYSRNGRHGAKSSSLFIDKPLPKKISVPVSGITTTLHNNIQISVPENASPTFFSIDANISAYESDDDLRSAMPSFFLYAKDNIGNDIKNFFAPITLLYKYAEADLSNIAESTLKMYFFDEDEKKWIPLPSSVDTTKKQVTAQTTHFTHFALMGDVKDTMPPTTSFHLEGQEGEANWFRSDVVVRLDSDDKNESGVLYTFYSINNGEVQEYKAPIVLNKEGNYTISYFSVDKADNREEPKKLVLHIDKTAPEAVVRYDTTGRNYDISPIFSQDTMTVSKKKNSMLYVFSDKAGNMIEMDCSLWEKENRSQFSVNNLRYNNTPMKIDHNTFINYLRQDKSNEITQINQRFSLSHEDKVTVAYAASTNSTQIIRREPDTKKVIEEKEGQHLLRLYTEKGALRYSF